MPEPECPECHTDNVEFLSLNANEKESITSYRCNICSCKFDVEEVVKIVVHGIYKTNEEG